VPFNLQHMVPAPFRPFCSPGPPVLHASRTFVCACPTRGLIRTFFCRVPMYLGRVLKPAGPTLASIRFCDADDLAVRAMNGGGGVRCPQCEPRSGATGVIRRSHGRPSLTLQNSESGNKSRAAGIMQWRVLNGLEEEMARRHVLTDSDASDARPRQRTSHGPDHAVAGSDWLRISHGTAQSDDRMFRLNTTRPTAEVAWPGSPNGGF